MGTDDYITKPFGMGELVERVNSHIKTYEKFKRSSKMKLITVEELSIDKQDRRVYVYDNEVLLTQKEFDLLSFLIENPNRVFSKENLFERVWGYDSKLDPIPILRYHYGAIIVLMS